MGKKVCMLVTEHPFLDARIFKKEAKSLSQQGYDVTLIAPRVNGWLLDIDGTKFINKFQSSTFIHDGIKIITYERFTSPNLKKLHHRINSSEYKELENPLIKLGIEQDADIYHAHEFLSFYSGVIIKRRLNNLKGRSVKLIYDSHELSPDPYNPIEKNFEPIMKPLLQLMLKEVDYVITVSDSIKSWYLSFNNKLPIEVIYNSPPLANEYKLKNFNKSNLIIAHEGIVHKTKGSLEKILKITQICNEKIDLKFKIIGGTKVWNSNKLNIPANLNSKVQMTGWIDYHQIPKSMQDVDIGWIDFNDLHLSLNRTFALPNKFFSFLNNGVPIIVNKCNDMERIIRTHNCGLVINKYEATPRDYVDAIFYLYNNKNELEQMSTNARKAMEQLYCWERIQERLFEVYERLNNNKLRFLS